MTRKIGDIIAIDIEMEIMASEEELSSKKEIDTSEYKREYRVSYNINDTQESSNYTLEAEPGQIPPEDSIRTFIKDELKNDFPEIVEYEILNLDDDYLHQSATVKITSVKN